MFYVTFSRNIDFDKSECDKINERNLYNIVSAVSGGNDKFLVCNYKKINTRWHPLTKIMPGC